MSCRGQPETRARRGAGTLPGAAQDRLLAAGRDPVQAPAWPAFGLGQAGILPGAGEQAGLFEAGQCLVQGAVGGQLPGGAGIADLPGHGEAVETGLASGGQLDAASQDCLLDRQQLTCSPAHAASIGRYLPIQQAARGRSPADATREARKDPGRGLSSSDPSGRVVLGGVGGQPRLTWAMIRWVTAVRVCGPGMPGTLSMMAGAWRRRAAGAAWR